MSTYGTYYSLKQFQLIMFRVFSSVELIRIEVVKDAELRKKTKQATTWKRYQSGYKPLRHRCVRSKDAKTTGNLVLLDVRNANNTNCKDIHVDRRLGGILPPWHGCFKASGQYRRYVFRLSPCNVGTLLQRRDE